MTNLPLWCSVVTPNRPWWGCLVFAGLQSSLWGGWLLSLTQEQLVLLSKSITVMVLLATNKGLHHTLVAALPLEEQSVTVLNHAQYFLVLYTAQMIYWPAGILSQYLRPAFLTSFSIWPQKSMSDHNILSFTVLTHLFHFMNEVWS